MDNNLEKEDIALIMQIAISIETLYIKLFNLEINGKKETEEYKRTIEYLKISIETENELLQNKFLNNENHIATTLDFIKEKMSENNSDNYKNVTSQNCSDRANTRIFNKLHLMYKEKPIILQTLEKYLDESEKELLQKMLIKNELDKSIERDFINTYLFLLQQYCTESQDKEVLPYLLSVKYNLSYSISSIEDGLINSKFEVPDTLCLESSITANIFSVSEEEYKMAKDDYGTRFALSQIIRILSMDSNNYSNPKNKAELISKQCFLRAAFILMDEETLEELNYMFHNKIESKEYLSDYPNNSINEDIIAKCFRKINNDKKQQHILAIRKK